MITTPQSAAWKRLVLSAAILCLCLAATAEFTISNQKFFLDGKEFYVKGLQYDPTPLGVYNMSTSGYGGGGLCSAKLTPYGEWKSACYDYDFYDGSSSSPDRVPAGPSVWYSAIWTRDLEQIANLGVNVIKLGSLNPFTEAAAAAQLAAKKTGVVNAYGKNHIPFFDKCASLGLKVLAPLYPNDAAVFLADTNRAQSMQYLIDEIGNHSALMAWYIGSNWAFDDSNSSTSLINVIDEAIDYVHAHSKVPISSCVSGLADTAALLTSNLKWDYICANAGWEGGSDLMEFLGVASDGSKTSSGWASLAKTHKLPILIGEAGFAGMNSSFLEANQHAFGDMLLNFLNADAYGVVGAVYQSYVDQPYHKDTWIQTVGLVTPSVAVSGINNSTQADVFWADNVSPKVIIYSAVSSGKTSDDQEVNYKTDLFSIMGRDPLTAAPSGTKTSPAGAASALTCTFNIMLSVIACFILGIYAQ